MTSAGRMAASLALTCLWLLGSERGFTQAPSTRESASGALQRGLTLMETRGDCVAALPHFATAAGSADAAVAARALYLSGQCLERLGRLPEARVSYDALVTRYPSHPLARQSRQRLQVLGAAGRAASEAVSLTLRRLDLGDAGPSGSLSGDGRYFAFHDGTAPVRRDLVTGRAERLALGGESEPMKVAALLLSRDGQQVAYMWEDSPGTELRLAPAVNGGRFVTLVSAGDLQGLRPVAWTGDGRTIIVVTTDRNFRVALQAVDVPARRMQVLFDLGVVEPFFVSLSPDGRRLLFDHAPGAGPRDIQLLDLDTRRTRSVVGHGANDAMPVFMPDGRAFLFASDRLGPLSLWRQSLVGGVESEPTLVRRDIGRIWPIGVTPNRTFLHGLQTGMVDVSTVRLSDDGRIVEEALPVSATFAGNNQAPDWSPDGRFLVYASTRGALVSGAGSRALVVREIATGQERLLYPEMLFLNAPRWSNDGTKLLVKGRSAATNQWGEFVVDVATGVLTPVLVSATSAGESAIGAHQWVPGRDAILVAIHGKGLVEVDLATRVETTVLPLGGNEIVTAARGCAYAPDGRMLAWSVRERRDGRPPESVLRVRTPDGLVREVLRAAAPQWLMLMAWAPDGQALYVVRQFPARSGGGPARTELWRVPLDGRPPTPTGLASDSLRAVAVHPEGKTVAYVTGLPTWEIWAMEGIR